MAIDITSWGIDENNSAIDNSCAFKTNYEDLNGPAELWLPAGIYEFNMMYFIDKDDIEFYGDTNSSGELSTTIKFKAPKPSNSQTKKWCQGSNKVWNNSHCYLEIADADNFNIHDLAFNGLDGGDREAGVWAKDGATNGTLKNLLVYDAANVSLVIGGGSNTNPAHHINVEDCSVYGQRQWDVNNSKAMIIAGGYGYNITFRNCETYSVSPYNNDFYSPADHFDTDNGTNVEYHNCTADGSGTVNNSQGRKGAGFWNEAGPQSDHETSSTYYDCTAIETGGGLAGVENSDVEAHNFTFDDCSYYGWAAWARCCGNFELYDSLFDGCAGIGQYGIKRGGFTIEGAPKGKTIKFKRNEFINTPQGFPHYDNINFYSGDEHAGVIEIIDNTFDDNVIANTNSMAKNTVYLYGNTFNGSDSELVKNEGTTNYNWINGRNNSKESATTTAVNSPTSSTSVSVEYQSHFTSVQYNDGESIIGMLNKMENAINADSGAYITADYSSDAITFTQEDASYPDNQVSIYINSSDWGNGDPFDPMYPSMS